MRFTAFHCAAFFGLATTIAVGDETPAPKTPLVYKLKPNYSYRYDFELRSGEDGDGFLQLDGSVSYSLVPNVERPSLIDEAFSNGDAKDGKVPSKPLELRFHGMVNVKRAPAPFIDGTIRITPRGDSFKLQGDNDYSLVSTTVGSLAFSELPPSGQTEWQSTRTREVVFIDEAPVGLPQRFPMLRFGRYSSLHPASPLFQRTTLNHISVEEKMTYELAELTDAKAVVKTRLVSSWISVVSGKKAFELEGSGQYTFDRAQNVVAKGHSQNELKLTTEGIEAKLPFKMAYALQEVITAEELKERLAKADAKRKDESEQRISNAIAVLKDNSSKEAAVRDALQSLAHPASKPVEPQREEVAALLNNYFKSQDEMIRTSAVRAAEDWATATNIPMLLELLKTEQSFRRSNIIQALGATGGNEKVASVLARFMETPGSRFVTVYRRAVNFT